MSRIIYMSNDSAAKKTLSTLERQFNLSECYLNKKEKILKNDLFLVWVNKKSIKIVTYQDDDLVINNIRSTIDSMVIR